MTGIDIGRDMNRNENVYWDWDWDRESGVE